MYRSLLKIVFISIVTVVVGSLIWRLYDYQNDIGVARSLVSEAANCPDEKFAETASALDPWGNPLVVTSIEQNGQPAVLVTSCGPDGRLNTRDDIVRVRHFFRQRLLKR